MKGTPDSSPKGGALSCSCNPQSLHTPQKEGDPLKNPLKNECLAFQEMETVSPRPQREPRNPSGRKMLAHNSLLKEVP